MTDFEGVLAQKEGSSSDTNVLDLTSATASAAAGTYAVVVNSLATTANGYLDPITNASDALSGSMTIQANGGATYTFRWIAGPPPAIPYYTGSGNDTLADLVSTINSADIGVTATVTTDANGSRLSLVSTTSGGGGSLSVTSAIADGSTALNYNPNLATGVDASVSINGVNYNTASNTVSNLIPGVTFQLLGSSASGSQVQVVISNDNSGVESAVNQFVNDYNSLISAVNTQEGNDSSGNPEPLFGSPTLSLLQQELLGSITTQNPNGSLDSISATAGVTLSGSMTLQVGSGTTYTFGMDAGTSSGDTFYTGSGNDTLADLASTINSANIGVTAAVVHQQRPIDAYVYLRHHRVERRALGHFGDRCHDTLRADLCRLRLHEHDARQRDAGINGGQFRHARWFCHRAGGRRQPSNHRHEYGEFGRRRDHAGRPPAIHRQQLFHAWVYGVA